MARGKKPERSWTPDPRRDGRFCSQVRRSIEFGLLDASVADPLLEAIEVDDVVPVDGLDRLDVRFRFDPSAVGADAVPSRLEVEAALEGCRTKLTAEVIQSISRRKVPELRFSVVLGVASDADESPSR